MIGEIELEKASNGYVIYYKDKAILSTKIRVAYDFKEVLDFLKSYYDEVVK